MSVYISVQGDFWDLISFKVYGMKRGDDHHLDTLMEANYEIKDLHEFPAGVVVNVPDLPIKTVIPLVPWVAATIVT